MSTSLIVPDRAAWPRAARADRRDPVRSCARSRRRCRRRQRHASYVGTFPKQFCDHRRGDREGRRHDPVQVRHPAAHVAVARSDALLHASRRGMEKVEIIDIASRKHDRHLHAQRGQQAGAHPQHRAGSAAPLRHDGDHARPPSCADRFEIGAADARAVRPRARTRSSRTIPWPNGEERENANIQFSPDGKLMYLFSDQDVLIYETASFTQVDKWELSKPIEEGFGRLELRVDRRRSTTSRASTPAIFTVAGSGAEPADHGHRPRQPGGEDGRLLHARAGDAGRLHHGARTARSPTGCSSEIGRYEFWKFDLAKRRLAGRDRVQGPAAHVAARPARTARCSTSTTPATTIDLYDAATYKFMQTIQLPTATRPPRCSCFPRRGAGRRATDRSRLTCWIRDLRRALGFVRAVLAAAGAGASRSASPAPALSLWLPLLSRDFFDRALLGRDAAAPDPHRRRLFAGVTVAQLRAERRQRPALHARVGRHPVRHAAGDVPAPAAAVAAVLRAHPARRHHVAHQQRHRRDPARSPRRPRWRGSATCCSSSAPSAMLAWLDLRLFLLTALTAPLGALGAGRLPAAARGRDRRCCASAAPTSAAS